MAKKIGLPFTQKELATALRGERRPVIRKRLLALRAVLNGLTPCAAARAAKTTSTSVCRWARRARESGLAGLLRPSTYTRRRNAMTAGETIRRRAEIAAALERCPYGRLHSRLRAIDAFLAGHPVAEAATVAQVGPGTLLRWLRLVRTLGITAALTQWQAPRKQRCPPLRADPAQLHALVSAEKNPNIRKRILALAYLAQGMSVHDAAVAARISTNTIYAAVRRFQREGMAAFRNKPPPGCRVRLASDQLEAVARFLRRKPTVSLSDLRGHVLAEFGVRYTPAGLKNMLKNQLGIVHGAAPCHSP